MEVRLLDVSKVGLGRGEVLDNSLEDAVARTLAPVRTIDGTEDIQLADAGGRIVAASLDAPLPLPVFDQAAVDGYALSEQHLAGGLNVEIAQRIAAGQRAEPLHGKVARVFTGAPVPDGCAAVLAQECCHVNDGGIRFSGPVRAGLNIRRRGEDIEPGDTVIESGMLLDPRHIAVAAALGLTSLRVRRRLRVAVLSNGDELRQPGQNHEPNTIYDCNRFMMQALLTTQAIATEDLGCLPDDRSRLRHILLEASEKADLIIVCGGMSVGDEDHVRPAVLDAGGQLDFVNLAIKPGKPASFGFLGDAVLLGLPGNPFAALVAFLVLGSPMIATLVGARSLSPIGIQASSAFHYQRRIGRTEFAPARIVGDDDWGRPLVDRIGKGGSARLLPLIAADGLVRIPSHSDEIRPGSKLRFFSLGNLFGW